MWLSGRWVSRAWVTDILALWLLEFAIVMFLIWHLRRKARRPVPVRRAQPGSRRNRKTKP